MRVGTVLGTIAMVISLVTATYVWNDREQRPPIFSTVIDLVAHGRTYDGHRTAVYGYVTVRPYSEYSAIYLSCEALQNRQRGLAVRLVVLRDQFTHEFLESLNGKYVLVSGTFEHPLTLADIEQIEVLGAEVGRPECDLLE